MKGDQTDFFLLPFEAGPQLLRWGAERAASALGVSVPLTEKGVFFVPEALTRIVGRLYGGLRYRYLEMETVLDLKGGSGKNDFGRRHRRHQHKAGTH